ncbi:hypothetical protein HU200_060089 [Digitaria exilis]|uniref:DUF1618 domain-containing protein n=1 Tax=Digitaria exilis TaxID=1010633 RepID=A0A835AHD1_9POAL|nr:hypothetical protein HU200_060089 [Digitaria exilis]
MAAPWVILRRFLGIVPKHAEAEHPAAISTALRAPPRVTVLAVGPSAHPEATRPDKVPYLVAAGPCGLLICFCVGDAPVETEDLIVARDFLPSGDPLRQPTTGSVERVPRRTGSMPVTCNIRSLALTPGLYAGDYVVTELKIARNNHRAKLLRFFSCEKIWIETVVFNPLSCVDREWSPSAVVAHEGKLWFIDLSWGIFSCDPTDALPVLQFHDLPPGRYISEGKPFIHTIRCISVSKRMLRYVDIARDLDLDGRVAEKKVVVWTGIPEPDGFDVDHGMIWIKTYEMSFRKIWEDDSYRATQLPPMVPEIVVMNPRHPNVVYLFLRGTLFGVDVPNHKVVGFVKDARKLVAPGGRHCVLPWDLPPSIANGNMYIHA